MGVRNGKNREHSCSGSTAKLTHIYIIRRRWASEHKRNWLSTIFSWSLAGICSAVILYASRATMHESGPQWRK